MKKAIFSEVSKYFEKIKSENFVPGESNINVGFPCYDSNEVISALDSLLDLRISQGAKVKKFESEYSKYIGTKYGIAVNSGSSANLLALTSLVMSGKVPRGSEVIVPAATFTTVVSPIIQCGLKPVFIDIEMDTYNLDPKKIVQAIGENTGLIMAVHSLGNPAKMENIANISKEKGIPILEDCCEAHGATIENKKVGSFGLISTWSFFVAHNITTGEGGMVTTDDEELNTVLRSIREFGRLMKIDDQMPRFGYTDEYLTNYDERYVFECMGYNVRMTDIAASLGIEQLKKLDELNEERNQISSFYSKHLSKYSDFFVLPKTRDGTFHSFYGYPILIRDDSPFDRTEIVRYLESRKIETRAFMGGNLTLQPAYVNENISISGELENTRKLTESSFFIGCHPFIGQDALEYVAESFDNFLVAYL